VTGVYNKVMNFRALDPRDARKGLAAAGETDRAVWATFYDPQTKQIRTADVEAEFNRQWPSGSETEPESIGLEEVVATTTGKGGQGFIGDSVTRKAVEDRAMDMAKEHYDKLFKVVEDVSKSRPCDLVFRGGETEVRVEVKDTTGDGKVIRLTVGEIKNSRGPGWRTDLFIVRGIRVEYGPDSPKATDGEFSLLEEWIPRDEDLSPEVFTYRVP